MHHRHQCQCLRCPLCVIIGGPLQYLGVVITTGSRVSITGISFGWNVELLDKYSQIPWSVNTDIESCEPISFLNPKHLEKWLYSAISQPYHSLDFTPQLISSSLIKIIINWATLILGRTGFQALEVIMKSLIVSVK